MPFLALQLLNMWRQAHPQGSGSNEEVFTHPGVHQADGAARVQPTESQKDHSVGQMISEQAPAATSKLPLPAAATLAATSLATHFNAPFPRHTPLRDVSTVDAAGFFFRMCL